MKQVTLNIPDDKYDFFMELVDNLGLSAHHETEIPDWQKEEVDRRLAAINKGKMSTRSWEEAKKHLFKIK